MRVPCPPPQPLSALIVPTETWTGMVRSLHAASTKVAIFVTPTQFIMFATRGTLHLTTVTSRAGQPCRALSNTATSPDANLPRINRRKRNNCGILSPLRKGGEGGFDPAVTLLNPPDPLF